MPNMLKVLGGMDSSVHFIAGRGGDIYYIYTDAVPLCHRFMAHLQEAAAGSEGNGALSRYGGKLRGAGKLAKLPHAASVCLR